MLRRTGGWARRTCVLALGALLAVACLSPTLPLPPPSRPDVETVGEGQYVLVGAIPEPGRVLALNPRTDLIYGQVTEGGYRLPVAAQPGDAFVVWYEVDLEASSSVTVVIPEAEGEPPGTVDSGTADGP